MMSSENQTEVTRRSYVLTVIGVLASMLLFLLIMLLAYVPNRPEAVNAQIVEERTLKFKEVEAKQKALKEQYAWIDENKGVVRIPVKRAMALTVQRIGK